MIRSKPKRRSKLIVITGSVLLIAGLAFCIYRIFIYEPTTSTIKTPDGKQVTLKKATQEEKQETEDNKQEIVKRNEQTNSNSNSSQKKSATLVVTSKDSSGIRAYINGVFEEGGTCTATATMAGNIRTSNAVGFQNVSYTQCAPLNWSSPLTPGIWNVTVVYDSTTTRANMSTTVEVK